jgi:hypothetical protein
MNTSKKEECIQGFSTPNILTESMFVFLTCATFCVFSHKPPQFNNNFRLYLHKRPGRGIHHPSPSSAEVKERVELYLYPPPLVLRILLYVEL